LLIAGRYSAVRGTLTAGPKQERQRAKRRKSKFAKSSSCFFSSRAAVRNALRSSCSVVATRAFGPRAATRHHRAITGRFDSARPARFNDGAAHARHLELDEPELD